MSALPVQPAASGRRARVLRALEITPWVRRAPPGETSAGGDAAPQAAMNSGVACVVVLPEQCSSRELDLIGRALNTCGAGIARAARVRTRHGQLGADIPEAAAYLVFGEAQAHALGRALPLAVMQRAQIVLADEPALVLGSAAAKRRLWSALRSLRRALAQAGS
ncbi:MAG: hypothetical protein KGH90_07475 [Xanthomonadaceae bacterium]|nr:hypothetical protein [Xanthomonadaceae bacterium]